MDERINKKMEKEREKTLKDTQMLQVQINYEELTPADDTFWRWKKMKSQEGDQLVNV